jgi:hypothetical protein
VEALKEKERQDETQFTTKIDGFLSFIPLHIDGFLSFIPPPTSTLNANVLFLAGYF